jgi:hypothetical protein
MSHPNEFVRVDVGTYALFEWGYSQAEYYPDIIASILKSEKKSISLDAIYIKVCQIRDVRQSTLTMLLSMHPRFYKSRENTYGLRVWLPPREKQTLRTPEWLVEDSDSIKRIEQSVQRGYDVESMIAVDFDQQ